MTFRLLTRMKEDIDCVLCRDPAARSRAEVVLTYSGVHAIWFHRVAHWLFRRNFHFFARATSQMSRLVTGIEIHPGAQLGRRLFIDHGMGVVIGETCEIGNDVTIYQGVTLGGTGKEQGKRHPTLEDGVLVAAGAKVLGSITIGENSKVGAGSVVLKDIPRNSTVVGVPGKVVISNGVRVKNQFEHQNMPDPVADKCRALQAQIDTLTEKVASLQRQLEEERGTL